MDKKTKRSIILDVITIIVTAIDIIITLKLANKTNESESENA